jgi:hypothetical protein
VKPLTNSLFCRLPSIVAQSAHRLHQRSVVTIDNMLLVLLALKSPCPESTGTTCKFQSEFNKTLPILVLIQVFPSSKPTPPLHDQFCFIQLFVTIRIHCLQYLVTLIISAFCECLLQYCSFSLERECRFVHFVIQGRER